MVRRGWGILLWAGLQIACADSLARPAGKTPSEKPPDGPPGGDFQTGVTVRLRRHFPGGAAIGFGLPVPPAVTVNPSAVRITAAGTPLAAEVKVLLARHDGAGRGGAAQALLVRLPASAMTAEVMDVEVHWTGGHSSPLAAWRFEDASAPSPHRVPTVARTLAPAADGARLVTAGEEDRLLFTGREPRVLATFPDGYLARSGILGDLLTAREAAAPDLKGVAFVSQAAHAFGLAGMDVSDYPLTSAAVVDPRQAYEGWLYDRCATFLTLYIHSGDDRFLRHAYRTCSFYASQIALEGPRAGLFALRPDGDPKYSHVRGLYAYYALTGDDLAMTAGRTIAAMWERDSTFVGPYRQGKLRGPDHLWTERLLGTSMEALYYGHRLTGDPTFWQAFRELFETAYRHITGDAAALAALNPGVGPFPPQNCFVHSSQQHGEGNPTDPWCSGWMSELLVDPLLRYQEQSGDKRVDEVLIRLVRFLRDVGSQYFVGDVQHDTFLHPQACFTGKEGDEGSDPRRLVPLYGGGLRADGSRYNGGEYADTDHCADATALVAAGLRALRRSGQFDARPVPPFPSEGASFVQLHNELAFCARRAFEQWTRPKRNPAQWSGAELKAGLSQPDKFIADNLIGHPVHALTPQRKLSWWFNGSLQQFALLQQAGVRVPALRPGRIQPAHCP